MKNIIKKIDDSPILFLLFTAVVVLLLGGGFITLMYCISLALGEGMSNSFSDTIRNFAWVFSMWATLTGGIVGLRLAWRGRKIQQGQWNTQQESHLQERYEKAAEMLSSELEATRIAACLSLADLGMADKSMKSRCVQLLFAFIREPYLETNEVEKYIVLKRDEKEKYLDKLFPADEPLRPDILQAIYSFSFIYEHYDMDGIDDRPVKLPLYFWQNERKGCFFLIKANLQQKILREASLQLADLRGADLLGTKLERSDFLGAKLEGANLQGAKLEGAILEGVNLRRASLWGAELHGASMQSANLMNADISHADMRGAKNLTKEQILFAKWGYGKYGQGDIPRLPKYLMGDEDIQRWLENPHYDERKKSKDSQ